MVTDLTQIDRVPVPVPVLHEGGPANSFPISSRSVQLMWRWRQRNTDLTTLHLNGICDGGHCWQPSRSWNNDSQILSNLVTLFVGLDLLTRIK